MGKTSMYQTFIKLFTTNKSKEMRISSNAQLLMKENISEAIREGDNDGEIDKRKSEVLDEKKYSFRIKTS